MGKYYSSHIIDVKAYLVGGVYSKLWYLSSHPKTLEEIETI